MPYQKPIGAVNRPLLGDTQLSEESLLPGPHGAISTLCRADSHCWSISLLSPEPSEGRPSE